MQVRFLHQSEEKGVRSIHLKKLQKLWSLCGWKARCFLRPYWTLVHPSAIFNQSGEVRKNLLEKKKNCKKFQRKVCPHNISTLSESSSGAAHRKNSKDLAQPLSMLAVMLLLTEKNPKWVWVGVKKREKVFVPAVCL